MAALGGRAATQGRPYRIHFQVGACGLHRSGDGQGSAGGGEGLLPGRLSFRFLEVEGVTDLRQLQAELQAVVELAGGDGRAAGRVRQPAGGHA